MIELIADGFFVDGIFERTFLYTRDGQNPDIHHIPYTGITPLYIHEYVVKDAVQSDLRMCTKEPPFYLQTVYLGFYFILCSCKA